MILILNVEVYFIQLTLVFGSGDVDVIGGSEYLKESDYDLKISYFC